MILTLPNVYFHNNLLGYLPTNVFQLRNLETADFRNKSFPLQLIWMRSDRNFARRSYIDIFPCCFKWHIIGLNHYFKISLHWFHIYLLYFSTLITFQFLYKNESRIEMWGTTKKKVLRMGTGNTRKEVIGTEPAPELKKTWFRPSLITN